MKNNKESRKTFLSIIKLFDIHTERIKNLEENEKDMLSILKNQNKLLNDLIESLTTKMKSSTKTHKGEKK